MPIISETFDNGNLLLRLLVYGESKAGKTHWSTKIAEHGLNVILVDGDDGYHIIRMLTKEAQQRIFHLDVKDKFSDPVFSLFLANLLKGDKFYWNEQTKTSSLLNKPSHLAIDATKFSSNDVLVIDSWSALCESARLQYSKEKGIHLDEIPKVSWDGYGWGGMFMNYILTQLSALPCHVIVIGHSAIKETKNKEGEIISTYTYPASFSAPHSAKLAQHFSDILYFSTKGKELIKINTFGDASRVGGCRMVAPKEYLWNEFQLSTIFKGANIAMGKVTGGFDSKGILAGTEQPATQTKTIAETVSGVQARSEATEEIQTSNAPSTPPIITPKPATGVFSWNKKT